jgi:hypothetical protein
MLTLARSFPQQLLASERLIDEMGLRLIWVGVRRLSRGWTAAPVERPWGKNKFAMSSFW